MTLKVIFTPASGNQTTLEATGSTVAAALETIGRKPTGMNIFVNGKAASLDSAVNDGDTINLTERPRGS